MFDAYDRDDPGRQLPHHRFFVADRERVQTLRFTYRTCRHMGLSASQARCEITLHLLHTNVKFR